MMKQGVITLILVLSHADAPVPCICVLSSRTDGCSLDAAVNAAAEVSNKMVKPVLLCEVEKPEQVLNDRYGL